MKTNVVVNELKTRTHFGYTVILRGRDYGKGTLDLNNDPTLFETKGECADAFMVGEDGCIAFAAVTWED